MPTAIVKLDDRANRVINIVKAKYGLNDKSEAINKLAEEYDKEVLEPELRPDFVERMKKAKKEKAVRVENIDEYFENLRKR
ncbi:MAG: DUF2683 family protein [Candidatus Diapherotrites archaeon]|nr:DUF2683 family protein [Candidatus Diapherotrites archaeon]